MGKIIHLSPRGAPPPEPTAEYDVTVYLAGGKVVSGTIDRTMIADQDDVLRIAADLEQLAIWLREQVKRGEAPDEQYLLGRVLIFADGRARLWQAGEIEGDHGATWLRGMLDAAKEIVQP